MTESVGWLEVASEEENFFHPCTSVSLAALMMNPLGSLVPQAHCWTRLVSVRPPAPPVLRLTHALGHEAEYPWAAVADAYRLPAVGWVFQVVEEVPIPGGGPPVWRMWRDVGASATSST